MEVTHALEALGAVEAASRFRGSLNGGDEDFYPSIDDPIPQRSEELGK